MSNFRAIQFVLLSWSCLLSSAVFGVPRSRFHQLTSESIRSLHMSKDLDPKHNSVQFDLFSDNMSLERKAAASDGDVRNKPDVQSDSNSEDSSGSTQAESIQPDGSSDEENIPDVADKGPKTAPKGLQYMPRIVVCVLLGLLFVIIVFSFIARWAVHKRRPSILPSFLRKGSGREEDITNQPDAMESVADSEELSVTSEASK